MNGFAGTRAEREWLSTLRRIASALEDLADQGRTPSPGAAPGGREAPYNRFREAVGEAPNEARRQAATMLEDVALELRSAEDADQGSVELLNEVATFLYETVGVR